MTLNITVVSPAGIHQSADFRISETERDATGKWIGLHENAAKIIPMHFGTWSGLLTYCGMGLWGGRRTEEYAAEWLAQQPRANVTYHEVLEVIRERGSHWIAGINSAMGKPMAHSFALAGFEAGQARYGIISNCQTLNGDIRPTASDLKVDSRSTMDVHVVVTGIRAAVTEEDRRLLKHLVETGRDPTVIQHQSSIARRRCRPRRKTVSAPVA